ncbi:hypothetical protein TWF481_001447 [Arthrobotrys musiformis]|uniref:Uncharacterized protein n=1 Tax=Arthrobotrys musiformis TaxID=47236 RepID=A0AAV9WSP5_9PEZI
MAKERMKVVDPQHVQTHSQKLVEKGVEASEAQKRASVAFQAVKEDMESKTKK